jgi:predicted metal-binding protein
MSFVPASTANKDVKQDPVLSCVNCPVKALKKEGSTYYCTHNFNISKNTITNTSLGDIPSDVVDHCKSCSLYAEKELEIQEQVVTRSKVGCPLTGLAVSVKDCGKCPCLSVKKTVDHLSQKSKDEAIDKVYCMYPNIEFKAIGVKFTPSKKKTVKMHIDVIKKLKETK